MLFLMTSFFVISLTMAVGVSYTISLYIDKIFKES